MLSYKQLTGTALLLFWFLLTTTNAQSDEQFALLKHINIARANPNLCNSPTINQLTWNKNLAEAAEKHSQYLHSIKRLSHQGKNAQSLTKRVSNTAYRWRSLAENLALNQGSAKQTTELWLQSKSHQKNLCSAAYSEVGTGHFKGFWVAIFASPRQ